MNQYACLFTDKGVVLLERFSTVDRSYRLVVEPRGDRMVVVKVGDGREGVLYESLDEDALELIKWDHLLHEEDPLAPGAEILLHHTLEEVVACLDGEVWAFDRALDRIAKAAAVNWRARYKVIAALWGDAVAQPGVSSPPEDAACVARATLERRAAEQGVALSHMLTLGLVDHVVTGRLTVGRALRVARRATFDQMLGYEPI